jgi:hypothetical protein
MRLPTVAAFAVLVTAATAQDAIPPDWEQAVIDPCESAVGFAAAALPEAADPYDALNLSTTDAARHEGRSLQWSFRAKEGAPAVALSHAGYTLKAAGAVSLWLKNPEDHDLRLDLRLVEADGSAYASEPVSLAGDKGWRQLAFMTDDLALAEGSTDENGTLELPPARLELVLEGVAAGLDYTLYIDRVMAHFPPPEGLRVMAISAPEAAAPGGELEARVTVRAPERLERHHELTLALVGGTVVVAETDLPFARAPREWAAGALVDSTPVRLRVPEFIAGGSYVLVVRSLELELSGPVVDGVEIEVGGLMAGSVTAGVVQSNGAPTLFVNGQPASGLAWICQDAGNVDAHASELSHAPLVVLPATADHDPYGWAEDVWVSREDWDYAGLDRMVMAVLHQQPTARLVLRVFICAPDWWDAENPRECILFAHGRHAVELPGVAGKQTYPSFSSETWRTDAGEALRQLVSHVEGAPYADHVVGYQLASGEDGRWREWGAGSGLYSDYSAPQTRAFSAWLREKYGNDILKLRGAWQRIVRPMPGMDPKQRPEPTLGWEDIEVPAISARTNHPSQSLLDPAAAPEVIDYNLFHARQIAGCIAELAAIAKQACHGKKLVGASYGHVFEHSRHPDTLQTAGHAALGDLLANPDIDFLAGPNLDVESRAGMPHPLWSSLAESVKSHGKLWVVEELPSDPKPGLASGRAQASVLAGAGLVWSPGEIGESLPVHPFAHSLNWDRSSVSQIALVVDHYSLAYMAQGNALSLPLLARQQAELAEVGAPYDVWLLDDLIAGRMPDYKLYVFVNAFFLDARAREVVRNHVGRNGKTALWIFAPGAMDRSMSGRTALELTGLSVAFVPKTALLRVKIVDAAHPVVDGVPKNLEYGTTEEAGPVFFALPNRGDMLGTIRVPSLGDGEAREWAGLIAREFDGWTSIYSAAPHVPAVLLRAIARSAGVHLYVDPGGAVYANASVVAVHALTAGDKRIRLPHATDVRDALSGEPIASDAQEMTVAMRQGETRIFYVGDPERFRP